MKLLALLCVLLLLPAVAAAQEPVATPTAGIEDDAPGVGDEDADDPVDDEDPVDGDDAYTCADTGTDADYVYCAEAGAGAPGPKEKNAPKAEAVTQSLPAGTLPYTGAAPGLVAALGVALLLMGWGTRMIASRSSMVRRRSSVTWR